MTGVVKTAALAASVLIGLSASPAAASAPTDSAAGWLSHEVTAEGHVPSDWGTPDWGLTVDTLIALRATGADDAAAARIVAALKANATAYYTLDLWDTPGQRIAGATAKVAFAAAISGEDLDSFGGNAMETELRGLIAGAGEGLESGRVKDKVNAPSKDGSNTFDQALAILALARTKDGAPASAVGFLLDQQCASGGFRLYPFHNPEQTVVDDCDGQQNAVLDPDSTSMAVQALLVAGERAAAEKGADWLLARQKADGSFAGSGFTADTPNANSTGLAGQALRALGRAGAADKAAGWVETVQLTASNGGAAKAEAGAIAYSAGAFAGAVADGFPPFRDQFRRSTAQALLAGAGVAMGEIGVKEGPEPSTPATSSPTVTPSNPGTPSATPSTGTTPSATVSPSRSVTVHPNVPDGKPGGRLPTTGAALPVFAGAAVLLLAFGVALVVLARRRARR